MNRDDQALNAVLAEVEAAREAYALMLLRSEQERAALEAELERARAQMEKTYSSFSWRVTAPLRLLKQTLRGSR